MSTWLHTHSGVAWDLARPLAEQVRIDDIAHALSQINRFNGHGDFPLSVAEHSVMVSRRVRERTKDDQAAMVALFHDAHEAYIGDVTTPMKTLLGDVYREVEGKNLRAVMEAIGIDEATQERWWPAVAKADAESLLAEKEMMFGVSIDDADWDSTWFRGKYLNLPWQRARDLFLTEARFYGVTTCAE